MFFFELECFFERIGVWLIDLEAEIGFFDPGGGSAQLRVAQRDLLQCDNNFHTGLFVFLENQAAVGAAETKRVG